MCLELAASLGLQVGHPLPFAWEALPHSHEAPQASQSCPSFRTWLPWAELVGGTSGNALSQAGQEGVGGLFPQVPNIHSTIQGLG